MHILLQRSWVPIPKFFFFSLFLSPSSFPNLRLLYLSRNGLSGPIPDSLPPRLVRVDLSDNSLAGPIPLGLVNLSALLTLCLRNNQLSGGVPDFAPSLRELDLSNNELAGSLPFEALTRFGVVSFRGNAALCGPSPLPNCTSDIVNPGTRTGGTGMTVPSNPSGPGDGHADIPQKKNNGLGPGSIVAIVLANVVALVAVSFMVAYCCSRGGRTAGAAAAAPVGVLPAAEAGGGALPCPRCEQRDVPMSFGRERGLKSEPAAMDVQ